MLVDPRTGTLDRHSEKIMHRKPQPLQAGPDRKHCPVCGEVTYSSSGIHPQCAMRQADEKRMRRVKRSSKSRQSAVTTSDVKPWQKKCPKRRAVVHCRKSTCDCGHRFVTATGTGKTEVELS